MFPGYKSTSSYPHQRAQMLSNEYYHHPRWEVNPPQVMADAVNSHSTYEPWHQNFGYPAAQWHNCRDHHNPSYCSFRPPHPHFPSAPWHRHCCGIFPSYPEPYPVHYIPPPHYPLELPRYEYGRSMPREYHCCGCPNHSCHVKEESNVKIEEQEAETENRKDSLFPVWVKESPRPIVWIPPGYMKSKEQQRKPVETEVKDHKEVLCGAKSEQIAAEPEPKAWNGWFPVDMKGIESLMQSADGKRMYNEQKKGQNSQLTFPIFWVPYNVPYNDSQKDDKRDQREIDANEKTAQEPSCFRIVPVKVQHPNDGMDESNAAVDDQKSDVGIGAAEMGNLETTSVKQMDELAKMNMKDNECNAGGALAEKPEDKVNKNYMENGTGKQPSSPAKKSKLPPVCLRVDPLPKKKNGNGSSRSPSPPGHKEKKTHNADTKSTLLLLKENLEQDIESPKATQDKSKEQTGKRKEIKVTEATERKACQDEKKLSTIEDKSKSTIESRIIEDRANATTEERKETKAGGSEDVSSEEVKRGEVLKEAGNKELQEASQPEKKVLSGTEAAVIIQSAYRGYEVRRWEPLKKLRQIAKVREQAAEVRGHVEALNPEHGVDNKRKAELGETIMKLLLRLDTIQGLHPSLRDSRKSVAKELISLQEQLDSLMMKTETSAEEITSKTAEEHPVSSAIEDGATGEREEKATDDIGNPLPGEFLAVTDAISGSKKEETSEPLLVNEEAQGEAQDEVAKLSAGCLQGEGIEVMKQVEPCEDEMIADEILREMRDPISGSAAENSPVIMEANNGSEGNEAAVQGLNLLVKEDESDDSTFGGMDKEASLLAELPQAVTMEHNEIALEDTIFSPTKDVKVEGLESGNVDGQMEVPDQMPEVINVNSYAVELERNVSAMTSNASALCGQEIESVKTKDIITSGGVEPIVGQIDDGFQESFNAESPSTEVEDVVEIEAQDEGDFRRCVGHEAAESTETFTGLKMADDTGNENMEMWVADHLSLESKAGDVAETLVKEVITDDGCKENKDIWLESTTVIAACDVEVGKYEDVCELAAIEQEKVHAVENKCVQDEVKEIGNDRTMDRDVTFKTVEDKVLAEKGLPLQYTRPFINKDESLTSTLMNNDSTEKENTGRGSESRILLVENEKLMEILEKLIASGKEQQAVISNLSGKVEDLERKLARRKRLKPRRPRVVTFRSACGKPSNAPLQGGQMGLAS